MNDINIMTPNFRGGIERERESKKRSAFFDDFKKCNQFAVF